MLTELIKSNESNLFWLLHIATVILLFCFTVCFFYKKYLPLFSNIIVLISGLFGHICVVVTVVQVFGLFNILSIMIILDIIICTYFLVEDYKNDKKLIDKVMKIIEPDTKTIEEKEEKTTTQKNTSVKINPPKINFEDHKKIK